MLEERPNSQIESQAVKPAEQPMKFFDLMTNDTTDSITKKRKHKKDKTAGLLYTISKDDKQLQKVETCRKDVVAFISKKKTGKIKSKPSVSGGQKPKVKMTNLMAPSHILKKPSILQLANALKKKNADPTTTADKLKKMLS